MGEFAALKTAVLGAVSACVAYLSAPFLGVLVYLIARGKGMTERAMERARQEQQEADAYIRQAAAVSPTEVISKAKALLDAGTISPQEFKKIKSSVLV